MLIISSPYFQSLSIIKLGVGGGITLHIVGEGKTSLNSFISLPNIIFIESLVETYSNK